MATSLRIGFFGAAVWILITGVFKTLLPKADVTSPEILATLHYIGFVAILATACIFMWVDQILTNQKKIMKHLGIAEDRKE